MKKFVFLLLVSAVPPAAFSHDILGEVLQILGSPAAVGALEGYVAAEATGKPWIGVVRGVQAYSSTYGYGRYPRPHSYYGGGYYRPPAGRYTNPGVAGAYLQGRAQALRRYQRELEQEAYRRGLGYYR